MAPPTLRLVPYDTTWPLEFAVESERIARACAGLPLRLEHIGSTAIPGLAAKPVIDILAGRPGNVPGSRYVDAFKQMAYEHKGAYGIPGRNYFWRGTPRTHHVHLVSWSSDLWRDHLLFYEYFHGDNGAGIGASHQTGWTGLVAWSIKSLAVLDAKEVLEKGFDAATLKIVRSY